MNLGLPEMIFIFVLALIIFGPKKMPEIGRQIGRALSEFKRASNEFKAQIETEINQMEADTNFHANTTSPVDTVANAEPSHVREAVHVESEPAQPLPVPEIMPPVKAPDA